MEQAVLDDEMRVLAGEEIVVDRQDTLPVLGVDAGDPFIEMVGEFMIGVTDDLLPARRKINRVRSPIPVPDALVAAGDGQGQTLLGLPHGLKNLASLRDIA